MGAALSPERFRASVLHLPYLSLFCRLIPQQLNGVCPQTPPVLFFCHSGLSGIILQEGFPTRFA
ncbi:MAG: hypothetical protein AB1442_16965, partial [Nitrospirota bacterium]